MMTTASLGLHRIRLRERIRDAAAGPWVALVGRFDPMIDPTVVVETLFTPSLKEVDHKR
ncbi:MAG: hypothetical protein QOH18_3 [Solirubrobacterales bacterium]|jgi:hypothetical protein|nr:hypothetical protein [Solirubrobacterales bacterium]